MLIAIDIGYRLALMIVTNINVKRHQLNSQRYASGITNGQNGHVWPAALHRILRAGAVRERG